MLCEVAIAMFNSDALIGTRLGDIVLARPALGQIGRKERRLFVWLYADITSLYMNTLREPLFADNQQLIQTGKHRFFVPTERLKQEEPNFDLLAAMSPREVYQPFIQVSNITGKVRNQGRLRRIEALTIDKRTTPLRG